MIATHPPILRILRIHYLIQGRSYPNVPGLARLLEASRRTIQRDIDFLRDQLGAPLAFNPIENGYEYTQDGFTLPEIKMTEGEILALMVADRALGAYRGTESEEMLRRLIEKAVLALGESRTVSPEKIAETYSFMHSAPPARVNAPVFAVIEKAIRNRETIEITYHTQSRATTSRRNVDPYHLANVDGDWYLLAFCHRRQQIRTFKPARIRKARPTGVTFVPRACDPEEFLRTKLRAMGGDRIFEAVVRFDASLAGHILERDWSNGYKVQTLMNGGVELSFRSENADALIRWCLSWGTGAEVISPSWARRRARQILRQLSRRYEGRVRPARTAERRHRPPSRPPSE
ncbi:MAG: YafY family transcriptional regulator [Candidatus Eisenbacteria bacterium]|nr:YafY family transcriptional regulator [Candidatus Eisenbacteria bacterium]